MTTIAPIPRIRINAEHQRLMWLNFSPALLACISILYVFFSFMGFNSYEYLQDPTEFYEHIGWVGKIGYFISLASLLILLRNSIQNDLKSQFWDQLRMSSLSAWQMTWTRLFTAPILAWCSILIGSFMVAFSAYLQQDSAPLSPLTLWLSYIFSAMIIAATALINYLQFGRSTQEWQGSVLQCVLLYFIISIYLPSLPNELYSLSNDHPLNLKDLITFDSLLGLVIILLLYVGLGVWHSMSYKLHLKSSHHYWLIATLALPFILALYQFVFLSLPSMLMFYLTAIYGVAALFSLSVQDNRPSNLFLALKYLTQGQLKQAFNIAPAWPIFLGLCIALAPIYFVMYSEGFSEYLAALFNLIFYAGIILGTIHLKLKFNTITLAMIFFLICRYILFLF